MHVKVCICFCMYVCICVSACMYICMCVYTYECSYISTHVCVCFDLLTVGVPAVLICCEVQLTVMHSCTASLVLQTGHCFETYLLSSLSQLNLARTFSRFVFPRLSTVFTS